MSRADDLRAGLEVRTTEELIAILRNRDESEWRPEVFTLVTSILASRGVSAAQVSSMGPEGQDVVEDQPLATLRHFFSPPEAHTARMALESAGIQAWVTDEFLGAVYGIGVGARLQVRLQDEDAARAILDDAPASSEALPPELAEPPCQKCGSRKVSQVSESIGDDEVPRVRGGRRQRLWYYDCGNCRHRWPAEDD